MRRLLLTLLLLAPLPLRAQPATRDVRLIVPFPAGGTADIVARLIAEATAPGLHARIVVDNRSGASGFIAAEAAARAPPDGNTVLIVSLNMLSVAPEVPGMHLPLDPDRDLAPIVNLARVPFILVASPRAPFTTVAELIAQARAHPGALTYASSGQGGGPHLAAELFRAQAGVDLLHVPYRGGAPAVAGILAGDATMIFGLLPELLGQLRAGALRPIALLTDAPNPLAPGVPLMRDTLPDYRNDYWYGLAAPAGTPPDRLAAWNTAANEALATPALRQRLADLALEPIGGTTAEFIRTIASDRAKWGAVVRAAGIRGE